MFTFAELENGIFKLTMETEEKGLTVSYSEYFQKVDAPNVEPEPKQGGLYIRQE